MPTLTPEQQLAANANIPAGQPGSPWSVPTAPVDPNAAAFAAARAAGTAQIMTPNGGSYPAVPTVLTSEAARTATTNAINGVNNTEAAMAAKTAADAAAKAASALNPPTNTPAVQPKITDITATDTDTTKAFKQSMLDSSSAYIDYKAKLDQIMSGTFPLTPTQQATIKSIQDTIDRQVASQEKINTALLGNLTTAGIKAGRQRYTAESNIDTLSDEQSQGVQRITDIQNKGLDLINQAKTAIDEKNFKSLNDAYNAFQANQKNQSDSLLQLLKINQDAENKAATRAKDILDQQKEQRIAFNEQRTFLANSNIQQPFYQIGGTIYSSYDNTPITSEQMAREYGINDDLSNVSNVSGKVTYAPGIIGEYQYRNSLSPDEQKQFDLYQTQDANRKRPVINVGSDIKDELSTVKAIIGSYSGGSYEDWAKAANDINKSLGDPNAASRYDTQLKTAYLLPTRARELAATLPAVVTEAQWNEALKKLQQDNPYADPETITEKWKGVIPKPSDSGTVLVLPAKSK